MPPTLETLYREFVTDGDVSPSDYAFFLEAAGEHPDPGRLRRMLRRRQLGEPREYVAGFQDFRGRRFAIDKRVYITDPELTHLVGVVVERGRAILEDEGRAPVIVEFGVGCGSLAISVKKALPEARVIGLDLDTDAITVATANAQAHHADVLLLESDLFSDLPPEIEPDIVFGDPPWGDEASIYDDERPATHYQAMPPLSAFPSGGITAVHEALLDAARERGWKSEMVLNLGILGDADVARLTAMTLNPDVLRFDNAAVLRCKVCG